MKAAASAVQRIWSEPELQALPEDGHHHEVVEGRVVMSPKNDFFHGDICSRLLAAIVNFNEARQLGAVLDSSIGFWMKNRNCRAPDISFVSRARLREVGFKRSTRKFFPGAPDLAVEILSPNQQRGEMESRLQEFFASGTRLAWVIDPDHRQIEVHRPAMQPTVTAADGALEGEDLLPGFRYPVADLFKEWDWT